MNHGRFHYSEKATRTDKTVLVVDDTKDNLTVIGELLEPYYRVRLAISGERALKVAQSAPQPDLILLDVMMPGMDGYAVIKRLREMPETRDIPVIFVTALDATEDEEKGLHLGAVDYLPKPIRPAILLARVKTHLDLKQAKDFLQDQNRHLDEEVHRRVWENELIKNVSLSALATLAEKRDNETGNHLRRVQAYIELLMERLVDHPKFHTYLSERQRALVSNAAPLHDIGKVGIPDQILLKPGRLTPEEFDIMKTHSRIGADAITDAIAQVTNGDPTLLKAQRSESPLEFLEVAHQIALTHHEKWDGSGYPQGLRGEDIPVAGRLMALADVFDALSCRRHYKAAMPLEQVRTIISEGRGAHFDPDIVDAFFDIQDQFAQIAQRLADPESQTGT